jgi:hypothetical protein
MRLSGEDLIKRFKKAKEARSNWEDLWQDIYDLVMPGREGFFAVTPGESRTDEIFDETAIVSLDEFAGRIQSGVIPEWLEWFLMSPGTEISDPAQRKTLQGELDEVTKFIWETIGNSNFYNEGQELINDIGVGWSTQLITPGTDGAQLNFKTVPQSHCFWDVGPFKKVDGVFRIREKVKINDLKTIWPRATISETLLGKAASNPDAATDLIEGSYRDWENRGEQEYVYQIVAAEDKSLVIDESDTGIGAKPFITPRWKTAAGEVYGRGPLISALPAIRTVNLVTEMVLENAQMSISGIWQVDDDGNINVDNVEIVPGAVYARPADSRGLERTADGGDFNVADLIIATMQENIRKALFAQNLGPVDKTPRSATEVNARESLAQAVGGSNGRLHTEWITPALQRVVFILTQSGQLELPRVDGREIQVVNKSPLARAQRFEEIDRIRGFAGDVLGVLGEQAAQLYIDQDEVVDELQRNWEVPTKLVRSQEEREEVLETLQDQATAQADQAGAGNGAAGVPALPAG